MAIKFTKKAVLEEFRQHVTHWKDCELCPLHEGRTQVVHFRGVLPCKVLLIGEAPGPTEDALGQPFIGDAGQLLDKLIAAVHHQLFRNKLGGFPPYGIINTVGCFPLVKTPDPNGITVHRSFRAPTKLEVKACSQKLVRLIEISRANLFILLGKVATTHALPHLVAKGHSIHSLPLPVGDIPPNVISVWHPSYIERKGGESSTEFKKTRLQLERFFHPHLT